MSFKYRGVTRSERVQINITGPKESITTVSVCTPRKYVCPLPMMESVFRGEGGGRNDEEAGEGSLLLGRSIVYRRNFFVVIVLFDEVKGMDGQAVSLEM